jgi:cobalamin biosynthesis Mg chelatase CobN
VTKPEAPIDWTDIDEGWDDPASPSESAPADDDLASAAPPEIAAPPSQARTKPRFKSKAERDAKAERKAAKQAARRAERRARAQNQKRPAPRKQKSGTADPQAGASKSESVRRGAQIGAEMRARVPTILTTPRGRVILTIAACILLLAGLVWFLGFRHGGTLSVG